VQRGATRLAGSVLDPLATFVAVDRVGLTVDLRGVVDEPDRGLLLERQAVGHPRVDIAGPLERLPADALDLGCGRCRRLQDPLGREAVLAAFRGVVHEEQGEVPRPEARLMEAQPSPEAFSST